MSRNAILMLAISYDVLCVKLMFIEKKTIH